MIVVLASVAGDAQRAAGEDFRVENKVFAGSQHEPVSQGTTIFHQGGVYDYLDEPSEIVVLEKEQGRFVLLDTVHRLRTELPAEKVTAFTAGLRETAGTQDDPFYLFLLDPKFEEQYDPSRRELRLSSPWMTYRVLLADPRNPATVEQYREFSDWCTQLNALLNPGSRPPMARMAVNEALARHRGLPREVHLTLTPKRTVPVGRVDIRSQHELADRITEGDLDRIAQTRQFMQIFNPVGFEEYRRRTRQQQGPEGPESLDGRE